METWNRLPLPAKAVLATLALLTGVVVVIGISGEIIFADVPNRS